MFFRSIIRMLCVSSCVFLYVFFSSHVNASVQLTIDLEVPKLDADPYFRPYVAVWLETEKRSPVATLAIWYQTEMTDRAQEDGKKWLKDLRQWWRKIGRSNVPNYDAVTGASKKPGHYQLRWSDTENLGKTLPAGQYFLMFEAAREEGGRTFHRVPMSIPTAIPATGEAITLASDNEFGAIKISLSALVEPASKGSKK